MSEKDFSLLRPFDPEAAERGEAICTEHSDFRAYVGGPDVDEKVCVMGTSGTYYFHKPSFLRMAPLEWIEGKPVYKGDALEVKMESGEVLRWIATGCDGIDLAGTNSNGKIHHIPLEDIQAGAAYFRWPRPVLCQVEGKPVYKDDPLYHKETGKQYIVSGGDDSALSFHNTEVMLSPTLFTWDKPKSDQKDGWIAWNGGECPVPEGTLVDVRYRFGPEKRPYKAERYRWVHYGVANDIVSYRVVEQPKHEPKGRKLWVNLYPSSYKDESTLFRGHETKEGADKNALANRLHCIEIELPPLAEVAK